MNARPVTWIGSALCVRRNAIMDMTWNISVMMTTTVCVEEEEMDHTMSRNILNFLSALIFGKH